MSSPPEPVRSRSWSGLGTDTEEGRSFFQERLKLFAAITLLMSLTFFVLLRVVFTVLGGLPIGESLTRPASLFHLATVALLALVWAACRQPRWSLAALESIDFGAIFVIGVGYALMGYTARLLGPAEYATVMAMTVTLFARAATVPSSARRTILTGSAAMIPVLLGVWSIQRVAAPGPAVRASLAVRFSDLALWCALAVAVASIASRVIYGLRAEVKAARQLGQYTLLEKLGEGGMGEVYRARHALLRRPTAIKLLPASRSNELAIHRFEREVQLTSELTHPSTVAIFDYGRTHDGVFYYAMEYLDGIDLDQLVRDFGPQPPERVRHIWIQACGSLGEAHGRGLIHRDIKPANIVLCERGGVGDVVKVLDFGLVKDLHTDDPSLSTADTITGTPLYISPEAITAPESVDARSDLYALGAVAYRLITGQHVFTGRTAIEVCGHHLHSEPIPPAERLGRPLPADLEEVILRCLRKDPRERPADALTLRAALVSGASGKGWGEADADAWWREHGAAVRGRDRGERDGSGLGRTVERALTVPDARGRPGQ